jgi:hypothetical protein
MVPHKLRLIYYLILVLFFAACSTKVETPQPIDPSLLQDGQSGMINNADLSGRGQIVNRANTTLVLSGNVLMDDLTIIGNVVVMANANIIVKGLVTVGGGAKLQLNGNLATQNLTLVGDLYINQAMLKVNGQFTAGGGTNTYFQNGYLSVNNFSITGNLYALENDFTASSNGYSMIEMTNSHYLNRAWGSNICGPLLWNTDKDSGGTNSKMLQVSPTTLFPKATIRNPYAQKDNTIFYQFIDQCTPLTSATNFL